MDWIALIGVEPVGEGSLQRMTINPFKESNSNLWRIYFTLYDEANLLFSSIVGCWASAGPKEGCVALEQQLRECMDSHVRIIHLPTPEFWHITRSICFALSWSAMVLLRSFECRK